MATQLYIPREVARRIQEWVRLAELAAMADFPQTSADEDAIVESFGTRLRCRTKSVDVTDAELRGVWTWSIEHTRFRMRGHSAPEKHVGADIIIELAVRRPNRYQADSKSLLIQAKKNWRSTAIDPKVGEQAARLSNWREAAAIINLTSAHFEAFGIDEVIAAKGYRPRGAAVKVSEFLANEFILGELGDETLSYDARKESLTWLDIKDTLVMVRFRCAHRLVIAITPPKPRGPRTNPALIDPEEIHEHRLKATPAQILGVRYSPSISDLKSAKRRLQKIYHTDKHTSGPEFIEKAMKRRSQEVNHAFDEMSPTRD